MLVRELLTCDRRYRRGHGESLTRHTTPQAPNVNPPGQTHPHSTPPSNKPPQAKEVLPVVQRTPVIAGVCATEPFRNIPSFLKQLRELGFAGVQNFPTVGLIDGQFRANLEETGFSFDKEVEMVRLAREMDMLTTPYVFTVEESRKMASAGADVLVCHMGLTVSSPAEVWLGQTC